MYNHPPSRRSHRQFPTRLREFYGIVEACPSRAKARVFSSPQHREVARVHDMPKTMHENEARDVYGIKYPSNTCSRFRACGDLINGQAARLRLRRVDANAMQAAYIARASPPPPPPPPPKEQGGNLDALSAAYSALQRSLSAPVSSRCSRLRRARYFTSGIERTCSAPAASQRAR